MFNRRLVPLYIGLFVFLIDFASKYYTHAYLPVMNHHWQEYPYGGIGVFRDFLGIEFSISHQVNYGAAWGMLAKFQLPLLYLRIALIAGLLIFVFFFNKHRSWQIPIALIVAGAIGNVVDYFLYGHVVDMFHFILWGYDYPVFNVADSAIFLGIASLIIISSRSKEDA